VLGFVEGLTVNRWVDAMVFIAQPPPPESGYWEKLDRVLERLLQLRVPVFALSDDQGLGLAVVRAGNGTGAPRAWARAVRA
jgi:hypothetical protein